MQHIDTTSKTAKVNYYKQIVVKQLKRGIVIGLVGLVLYLVAKDVYLKREALTYAYTNPEQVLLLKKADGYFTNQLTTNKDQLMEQFTILLTKTDR